jgi:hypothetical protein
MELYQPESLEEEEEEKNEREIMESEDKELKEKKISKNWKIKWFNTLSLENLDDKELERIMTENLETDPDEWFKVVQSLKTDKDPMAIKICELATKQLKNVTQKTTTRRRSKRKKKEDFETGTYLKETVFVKSGCIYVKRQVDKKGECLYDAINQEIYEVYGEIIDSKSMVDDEYVKIIRSGEIPKLYSDMFQMNRTKLMQQIKDDQKTLYNRHGTFGEILLFEMITGKKVNVYSTEKYELWYGSEDHVDPIELLLNKITDAVGHIVYHYSLLQKVWT